MEEKERGEGPLREDSTDSTSSRDSSSCNSMEENGKIEKPQREDSTESASSSSYRPKEKVLVKRRKERTFPPMEAALWKYEHLQKLGIMYADKPISIEEFMSSLKTGTSMGQKKLPSIFNTLQQMTKDFWQFSFNYCEYDSEECPVGPEKLNEVFMDAIGEVEDAIKKLETATEDIKTQISDELNKDTKYNV